MNASDLYNVNAVMANVSEQNPDGSREFFMQAILDWTDNYSETLAKSPESDAAKNAVAAIGDLWIAYATFEKTLRQWKKCVQVYEDALSDSVASLCDKVYFSYAEFCQSRGKYSNAQKVYIRALSAQFPTHITDKLWKDFLGAMHAGGATTLTLEMLYAAVVTQTGNFALPAPPAPAAPAAEETTPITEIAEAKEEAPLEAVEVAVPMEVPPPAAAAEPPAIPPAVAEAVAASVKAAKAAQASTCIDWSIDGNEDVDGLLEEYRYRPPVLFCAPDKEPLVSGLEALSPLHKAELEAFLNCSLEQAVEVDSVYNPDTFVCRLLDIVEGMWLSQALKERHFDGWFNELFKSHHEKENQLQRSFSMMSKQSQKNTTRKQEHQVSTFMWPSVQQGAVEDKSAPALLPAASPRLTIDAHRNRAVSYDDSTPRKGKRKRRVVREDVALPFPSYGPPMNGSHGYTPIAAVATRSYDIRESYPAMPKKPYNAREPDFNRKFGPPSSGDEFVPRVVAESSRDYAMSVLGSRGVGSFSRAPAPPPPPAFVPPPPAFKPPPPEFRPPPSFRAPPGEPPRKKPAYNSYAPPDHSQLQRFIKRNPQQQNSHYQPYQRQQYDPFDADTSSPQYSPPAYQEPPHQTAVAPQPTQRVEAPRTVESTPHANAPINEASLPLLQKLASMLKNAKK